LRDACYPHVSDAVLQKRFEKFGKVPRLVFGNDPSFAALRFDPDAEDSTAFYSHLQRSLATTPLANPLQR